MIAPEVRTAIALDPYVVRVVFADGEVRDVDIAPLLDGPVFLELNTLPGLTRMSFVPQQLAAEGTSMRDFLEGQLAIARSRRDRS